MNPQDPLAALHPLREPAPIDWWPPAPGWWVLLALSAVAAAVLVWRVVQRYRANAYRRAGLHRLQELQREYRRREDDASALAELNALLKAVALQAFPAEEVAAASGERWVCFLNDTQPGKAARFPGEFASAAYLRQPPALDIHALHAIAAAWIRRHRSPS